MSTQAEAQQILDTVIGQITGYKNPLTLDQFLQKYAFDVRLPAQVNDSKSGEITWAQSTTPSKFVTMDNAQTNYGTDGDWLLPKKELKDINDILASWQQINATTTERQIDSLNAHESDNVYNSENVYRSQDIHFSKNIVFCDGVHKSEFVVASQRSNSCIYSARVEDSKECSQSFGVSWSGKIVNSAFIHDAYDLYECLFCSHMRSKKFCIANMQFEEAEYYELKKKVMQWLLTTN